MDIREKLKKMLDERGWTEYRLTKECGLSESTIANIYRRNSTPSLQLWKQFARHLVSRSPNSLLKMK